MTTKYTPGPWIEVDGAVQTSSGNTIFTEDSVFEDDVRQCNVRLAAAAPDLLEALKWYVENDDTNDSVYNEFYLEGLANAQRAIAKAADEQ